MSPAATNYWCEVAVIDGIAVESVVLSVEDGRFVGVAADVPAASGMVRLAGVSLPGLANAHSHAFHRVLRSRTQRDGGSFWTWRDVMYRAAERLDPDRYLALVRATFAEMALAGITSVGEFHYVHHRPDGSPYDDPNSMGAAVLTAAEQAGIRITLLDTLYLHGGLGDHGYVAPSKAQRRFSDQSTEGWAARVDALAPRSGQIIGAAVHSVRAVDERAIATAANWARERGVPLHAHVSEQVAENEQSLAHSGRTPTEVFDAAGAIDDRFTAVHATHLTRRDIELLAGGATVCMCPTTERDLGDGIGPSNELVRAGVRLSLGSDSHAMIDMFEEARAVELDERLHSQRRGVHRAQSLLDAATVHGHGCLGWSDAGRLAVGQRADLVTVALDSPRTAGTRPADAVEAAVFAATASDVRHVLVDGRVVVADRHHVSIDVPTELERAIAELMGD